MEMYDKLVFVAKQVRMKIEEEYSLHNPELDGTCVDASERIIETLKELGISADFITGYVEYDIKNLSRECSYEEHCWVEVPDGDRRWYIDVTATQFNNYMLNDYEPVIVSDELHYGMVYDEPYWDDDWDECCEDD